MKYHIYDEEERHQGKFNSVYELRKFLCDRKYDISCDADLSCTFDYIKHIKWHFDIDEQINILNEECQTNNYLLAKSIVILYNRSVDR